MRARTRTVGMILGFLILLVGSAPVLAEGDVNFILGTKQLDEDDWGTLDEHGEFGVLASFGPDDWPIRIAVDVLGTADEVTVIDPGSGLGVSVQGMTSEIDVGVRKIWVKGNVRPFLGGGIGLVQAEIEAAAFGVVVSSDDTGVGVWIDGGVFWRIAISVPLLAVFLGFVTFVGRRLSAWHAQQEQ